MSAVRRPHPPSGSALYRVPKLLLYSLHSRALMKSLFWRRKTCEWISFQWTELPLPSRCYLTKSSNFIQTNWIQTSHYATYKMNQLNLSEVLDSSKTFHLSFLNFELKCTFSLKNCFHCHFLWNNILIYIYIEKIQLKHSNASSFIYLTKMLEKCKH